MSLAQKLKRNKPNRFFRPKEMENTGDFSAVVKKIIEELIKPRMELLEKTVRFETEKAVEDIKDYMPYLKTFSEREIKNHIATRSVEIRGIDGKDGVNGSDGKDGLRGEQGLQGFQGNPGKDGSPDTPDGLITKINKATSKIDFNTIQGLDEWVKKVQSIIRDKGGKTGGGMGQWVHEEFSTSSATTSLTLQNNVAGNGNVIFLRYQGQVFPHGVNYTVSGKTVSLLVTLDDNTKVDVSYVRT